MRPLLKWAGGKARLAPRIREAFGAPCEGTYFEPFCGSGAVFFHLRAEGHVAHAVLSDVNPKLVAAHVAVRDRVEQVLRALERLPQEDWKERYYDVREAFNAGPWEGPEHAARFFWLNRAGFNGLYRENRRGAFNVPVGRYRRLSLPSPERFRQVSAALQGVELVTASFEAVLKRVAPGDHVYCDPPYVPLSVTASFTSYQKQAFGPEQQEALARHARRAAIRGARVVLSNHDLPLVRRELYPVDRGFEHVARPRVSRAISRKGSSRGPVGEVIARIGPLEGAA
jgi:DNA adenine methylase